ncbi:hypothetical protein PGTUg99_032345 [Puccinia graminis f. sp. tritici]|uniref:Uncharacterized protein n=1 Tax=Puccinia graminis f. sp. tritici TaxID=56615 RepID=A0A5B0MIL7_PUCGR|nr:hypothetical protein PGTUg99_032345 [Puccinia graminis f. sp. tritici]
MTSHQPIYHLPSDIPSKKNPQSVHKPNDQHQQKQQIASKASSETLHTNDGLQEDTLIFVYVSRNGQEVGREASVDDQEEHMVLLGGASSQQQLEQFLMLIITPSPGTHADADIALPRLKSSTRPETVRSLLASSIPASTHSPQQQQQQQLDFGTRRREPILAFLFLLLLPFPSSPYHPPTPSSTRDQFHSGSHIFTLRRRFQKQQQ